MQGRDGGPPEVVRVCGRAGGEDSVFAGGCSGSFYFTQNGAVLGLN